VEEKPPQQKPIGTAFREKRKQNVKADCVLTGDALAASLFGIQKNRRIERVHVRFANLKKRTLRRSKVKAKIRCCVEKSIQHLVFFAFYSSAMKPLSVNSSFTTKTCKAGLKVNRFALKAKIR